jgi:hypothetical protein
MIYVFDYRAARYFSARLYAAALILTLHYVFDGDFGAIKYFTRLASIDSDGMIADNRRFRKRIS